MKNTLLTLICAVAATTALSQSDPTSSRTLTLAPEWGLRFQISFLFPKSNP